MSIEQWRFTNLEGKAPKTPNWQHTPLQAHQITTKNVGLLLGEHSGGVAAIDFDGYFGIDYFTANVMNPDLLPKTVIWSSQRPGRCQMAFNIPQHAWHELKTFKTASGFDDIEQKTRKHLEFRWNGCQSVIPPSIHPDTNEPYVWLVSPLETEVAMMPDPLVDWWKRQVQRSEEVVYDSFSDSHENDDTVSKALYIIHSHVPVPDYDIWIRIAFATAKAVGVERALAVLSSVWPEQNPGEYRKLLRNFKQARAPGIGSLILEARNYDASFLKKREPTLKQKMRSYKLAKQVLQGT
jgi:hypothetical protein